MLKTSEKIEQSQTNKKKSTKQFWWGHYQLKFEGKHYSKRHACR